MDRLVELSKIFSDKNRLKILGLIQREKRVCVCEICDTFSLSQPLVSRHLKVMKIAGVVDASKEKQWIHYSLVENPHPLLKVVLERLQTESLPKLVVCSVK